MMNVFGELLVVGHFVPLFYDDSLYLKSPDGIHKVSLSLEIKGTCGHFNSSRNPGLIVCKSLL